MQEAIDLYKHIAVTPGLLSGKPHVLGHRISVQDIVVWHEHFGQSVDEISTDYDLDLAQVYAALTYYFDNREEIDLSIANSDEFDAMLHEHSSSLQGSRSADLPRD